MVTSSYRAVDLTDEEIVQSLPLVQVTWPGADLASWRDFVAFYAGGDGRGGVLGLRDPSDYLCGVLVYRREQDIELGPILTVPLFTTVDMGNSLRVAQALLDAVEVRAGQLGCGGVQIRLQRDQAGLTARLQRLGLTSESRLLTTTLSPPQKSN